MFKSKGWLWLAGIIAVILICLIVSFTLSTSRHLSTQTTIFPAKITRAIRGFRPYYLKSDFSSNFRLDTSSIAYQDGVLVFSLINPSGTTLVFSEEAMPNGYAISQLQADRQFQTGYGQAFIADAALRTTGALFTSDRTWILINAPTPIGADLMQQILEALQPYN